MESSNSDHASRRAQLVALAAPFVLTVSVASCSKSQPVEPEYQTYERDGECFRERTNFECRTDRTCNPPPPKKVPCPPELAPAGETKAAESNDAESNDAKTGDAEGDAGANDAKTGDA